MEFIRFFLVLIVPGFIGALLYGIISCCKKEYCKKESGKDEHCKDEHGKDEHGKQECCKEDCYNEICCKDIINIPIALIFDLFIFIINITGLYYLKGVTTMEALKFEFTCLSFTRKYALLSILIAIILGILFGLIKKCLCCLYKKCRKHC